jgi:hypothetical protein
MRIALFVLPIREGRSSRATPRPMQGKPKRRSRPGPEAIMLRAEHRQRWLRSIGIKVGRQLVQWKSGCNSRSSTRVFAILSLGRPLAGTFCRRGFRGTFGDLATIGADEALTELARGIALLAGFYFAIATYRLGRRR